MDENQKYSTRDFSFEKGKLFIYRKRVVQEIHYNQISTITLKKGSALKRPRLTLVVGALILLHQFYVFSSSGFDLYIYLDSGLFFLAGIGLYAIYTASPLQAIIEISFDHETERYPISQIVKSGRMESFTAFLQTELGPLKVVLGDGV